jgi:hypothetical protein
MGRKNNVWTVFAAALILGACAGGKFGFSPRAADINGTADFPPLETASTAETVRLNMTDLSRMLEELAEAERSGAYAPGMGLAESGLRESAGDYAGAVAAAYKELAWGYGWGVIQKQTLEQGLLNVLALKKTGGEEAAVRTAEGIFAFTRGQWAEAEKTLGPLFDESEEPDGFVRWMVLVCALEQNRDDRQAGAAYRAIRARYGQFPEYWYRGARIFTGAIAAEYAEQCISLVPNGPFAGECRNILASFAGLKKEDGSFLKSKLEIEDIISRSLGQGDPEILSPLIALIALPDNPYTIYALGALRALAAAPKYRDYFSSLASGSEGRLAERLAYICRG